MPVSERGEAIDAEAVAALQEAAAKVIGAAASLDLVAGWAAVREAGLPAALLPESAGGFGMAPADALSLLRAAGAHALGCPLAEAMLAGWLLAGAGIDVPDGMLTLAAEHQAVLRRVDGGWRISGTAWDVAWGREAAGVVLLAEHAGTVHAALVQRGSWVTEPGSNIAGDPRDTLTFDGPALAAPASTTGLALRAAGAATRAIMIAGAIEAVMAMTVRYANDRVQFGKPIGRQQAVQQSLAVLAGQTAAAGAAADMAAEAFVDAGGAGRLAIAAAKVRANEAAGQGAAIAHQVHGAIGFTEEYALHRLTRRLWAWRDEYGTETEWAGLLGRHMAAAGPDGLWPALTAIGA